MYIVNKAEDNISNKDAHYAVTVLTELFNLQPGKVQDFIIEKKKNDIVITMKLAK
jgi:hypothetical protein